MKIGVGRMILAYGRKLGTKIGLLVPRYSERARKSMSIHQKGV